MRRTLIFGAAIFLAGGVGVIFLRLSSPSPDFRQAPRPRLRPVIDSKSETSAIVQRKRAAPAKSTAAAPVLSVQPRPAPLGPKYEDLSPQLRLILGMDTEKKYLPRMRAAQRLPANLKVGEVRALFWFLRKKFEDQGDLSLTAFNGIKNSVLERLMKQERMPDDFVPEMIAMSQDPAVDVVWRDYCVQHFPLCYERLSKEQKHLEKSGAWKDMLLDAFWAATEKVDETMAGTALIGLHALSEKYAEIDREQLSETALELAAGKGCGPKARTTAIQICVLMGEEAVLPTARMLAQTADRTPLRVSAISAVGSLGADEDLELLATIAASGDQVSSKVARSASQKLRKRLHVEHP